jgi:hypothetical protein
MSRIATRAAIDRIPSKTMTHPAGPAFAAPLDRS